MKIKVYVPGYSDVPWLDVDTYQVIDGILMYRHNSEEIWTNLPFIVKDTPKVAK